MVTFKIFDFDELQKQLDELVKEQFAIKGNNMSYDELPTNEFMLEHTQVSSFDDFKRKSSFNTKCLNFLRIYLMLN